MTASLNRVHITAFTNNHLFQGMVITETKRLSDLLNDRILPYMGMLEAQVYDLMQPDEPLFTAAEFYLKKQRLMAVAILKEEVNVMPQRPHTVVQTQQQSAILLLRSYQVRGHIHLHSKQEVMGPLMREGRLFVPVTDATLTALINPKVELKAPTILLRESALDGFCISEEG